MLFGSCLSSQYCKFIAIVKQLEKCRCNLSFYIGSTFVIFNKETLFFGKREMAQWVKVFAAQV